MTTKTNTATALAIGTVLAEVPVRTAAFPVRATVNDWCKLSGMGRSATYEALGRADLHAVKLGSRVLIDVPHGLAWLDSLPPAAIRPHGAKRTKHSA